MAEHANITRRTILKAAPAALVTAALPLAAASADTDTPVMRQFREWCAYLVIAAAAILFAIEASAASISASDLPPLPGGRSLASSLSNIGGPCGTGRSVTGNGCQSVIKTDPKAKHAFGRFDPEGKSWIDSQDGTKFKFKVEGDRKFNTITFALTDAFDQKNRKDLGKSHFSMSLGKRFGDASWTIDKRQKNGTLNWITIKLSKAVRSVSMVFSTRQNDGFGVSSARGSCR